ncbi:MAG: hypothetical protein IBJ12_05970 [Sphingomonadaceae bacterium]|nr:hypothetical protein [Sphingomonadaceae bacterium]
MTTLEATQVLVFSGALAILVSSLLGFAMLIPLQPWGRKLTKDMNFKQIGSAHLDWIMLGLMQALAGGLIFLFDLSPAIWVVWAMVAGGWLNPLPYVFRAFGVNAFVFDGGLVQRAASALGGLSSTLIVVSWIVLISTAWSKWP